MGLGEKTASPFQNPRSATEKKKKKRIEGSVTYLTHIETIVIMITQNPFQCTPPSLTAQCTPPSSLWDSSRMAERGSWVMRELSSCEDIGEALVMGRKPI